MVDSSASVQEMDVRREVRTKTHDRRRIVASVSGLMAAVVIVGCSPTVRVEAPDEPIEINLNVRITQEVRIRVDRELEEVFSENDDIF